MKDYQEHNLTLTEPAWNPLAATENTPKPNFAIRPNLNFDQVNCSHKQSVDKKNSFRPQVGQTRGEEDG